MKHIFPAALLALAACHKSGAGDVGIEGQAPGALTLATVEWNATDGGVGKVQAVTENLDNVYVFSDQGVQTFAAGTPLTSDATVTAWAGAATIPAADGNGSWAVGLDSHGALWHVRATGEVEAISARYGLAGTALTDVEDLGGGLTAFGLASGVAVSDGQTVQRFDTGASRVAGGQGRAAWQQGDTVRRLDPVKGTVEQWHVPGAQLLAMNSDGRLAIATPTQIFRESGTLDLDTVYIAAPGTTISTLVAAGERFWFVVSGKLGVIDRNNVLRASAAGVPAGAKLVGSPSGDVWMLQNGQLTRLASAGSGDFAQWQQTVLPVFSRVCASCHLPAGTAGIDLSSYEKWTEKRKLIYQRVVDQQPSPMPPSGSGVTLSDADLAAIKAWASNPG